MNIIKIGGSKILTSKELYNLILILNNVDEKHFYIVSAFGKTTSILNKSLELAKIKDNSYKQILNHIFHFHLNLLNNESFIFDKNNTSFIKFHDNFVNILKDIELKLNAIYTLGNYSNKTKDKILSYGEIIAFEVLSFALQIYNIEKFTLINATDFVITNENYGNAEINFELTKEKLLKLIENQNSNNQYLYITQGFIGNSINGNITTMGYESSNLTAVVIANIFETNSITIVSDTFGILNSDPRFFDNNLTIKHLNYKDAEILSLLGVKLLYQKMINFAILNNITLYYKSLYNYDNFYDTIIDTNSSILNSSVYLCDVKYKKFDLNGLDINNLFNNTKLENSDYIFSNSLYTNKVLLSENFIPLIKISIFNFKLNNFEKFYSKFSFIIDNIITDNSINTIFIFFDKIKMKEFCDENLDYKNFEKELFSEIKLYL